jgi:hypothetical protein
MIRRWQFIVSGYKFRFSWGVKAFANANDLSLPQGVVVFDTVRVDAEERLRIVKQRMNRTGYHKGYERDKNGEIVGVYSLSYAELPNFLQRDDDV